VNEYRIEKDPHPVTVTLFGGERVAGAMFVQAHARRHVGREDPADILNEPDPFFPFRIVTGDTLLISKSRVVEVAGDIPSRRQAGIVAGTPAATVVLTLIGGAICRGTVYLEAPHPGTRLLDFFNHLTQRFFALHGEHTVRLINRDFVERVQPLD
jgi:hypothetical protein